MLRLAFVFAVLLAVAATPADAQTTLDPMPLWPGGAPGAVADSAADRPTIRGYLPASDEATGAAVVVFPGGGYRNLAVEKEGTRVAEWLRGLGIAAFVVEYRLGPRYHHPAMIEDAQRALRIVRTRAAAWGVDPERVGVMGFSAGGHLASTVGTRTGEGNASSADSVERASAQADLLLLVYPVITLQDPWAHAGSRRFLLGEEPDPALVWALSNEQQVTPTTPPTFLVASTDDTVVPIENTLLFYDALRRAGVPAELHVFETAGHGFGPYPDDPAVAQWLKIAEGWLHRHGWLDANP